MRTPSRNHSRLASACLLAAVVCLPAGPAHAAGGLAESMARAKADITFLQVTQVLKPGTGVAARRATLEELLARVRREDRGLRAIPCARGTAAGPRAGRASRWIAARRALVAVAALVAGEGPLAARLLESAHSLEPTVEEVAFAAEEGAAVPIRELLARAGADVPGPTLVQVELVLDPATGPEQWRALADAPALRVERVGGRDTQVHPGPDSTERLRRTLRSATAGLRRCNRGGGGRVVHLDLPLGAYRLQVGGSRAFGYVRAVPGARVRLSGVRAEDGQQGRLVSYLGPRLL